MLLIIATVQNQVNTLLDSANSTLQCVSTRLYPQQCEIDRQFYDRLTSIEDVIRNSGVLLNQVNNSLTDTLALIDNQTNMIPTIQNHSATNNGLIQRLNVSVQDLRQRMATARTAVDTVSQQNKYLQVVVTSLYRLQ